MRGEQEELETPDAGMRWREGFRRHEAIRGLLERHSGLLRTADVKDVAWDLGVSQATALSPHRDPIQGHRNRRGLDAPDERPACRTSAAR